MVAIEGVDYAFGGPLSSAALKANGKAFAGRYVVDDKSPAGRGITAAEYRELTNGGVDVFVYWEAAESWMLRGWNAGVAAAQNAQANILAAGMPANVPVYFACDFDAQAPEMPAIDDCLRGAASVIGADRVGVYGGYSVLDHCHAAGTARWFCQTIAWEFGRGLHPAAHLYQYDTQGNFINGVDVDLVRAVQENYGQDSRKNGWAEGMDVSLARRWYGRRTVGEGVRRFAEDAEESLLWKQLGRFPRLLGVDRFDTREYLRFADGTVIWRPNDRERYRVMGPPGPGGGFPEGMDAALAKRWFGRVTAGERTYHFSPRGAVSRVWLESGQFARLTAVEEDGAARYFVFANGTVIWRPTPGAAPALLAGAAAGTMPAGLTEERAARWFGSAAGVSYATHDSVRPLWLALGRFPALAAVERYDDRTYLRFADGSVAWRPNDAAAFRLLG